MRLRKVIPEGGVYPKGYGVAWDDYRWGGPAEVVCYPVPLNLVLGVLRKAFLWCRYGMPWRYSRVRWLEMQVRRMQADIQNQNLLISALVFKPAAEEGEEWKHEGPEQKGP